MLSESVDYAFHVILRNELTYRLPERFFASLRMTGLRYCVTGLKG